MMRLLKRNLRVLLHFLDTSLTLALGELFFRGRGLRRGPGAASLTEMRRILVIRLDQIGDFVLTTPLLRELRRNAPSAKITLVVKPELRELASCCPYVDEVLTFEWHIPSQFLEYRRRGRAVRFCAEYFWHKRLDLAIVPRWDTDWYCQIFLAYLSGARRRVAHSETVNPIKQIHNRCYDRLLTEALHDSALAHEAERNLNILRALGGEIARTDLEIWASPADDLWAQTWLGNNAVSRDQPVVAFGPFVGNSALKQWPLDRFAALGRRIVTEMRGQVIILGGPGDREDTKRLCDQIGPGTFNAAGQCSLPQTVALLKSCALYVGDDSGPMHLASALDIPVVALFGPSCPHRFAPWNPKKTVLWKQLPCSPCAMRDHDDCCTVCIFDEPRCIQSISAEEVWNAAQEAGMSS